MLLVTLLDKRLKWMEVTLCVKIEVHMDRSKANISNNGLLTPSYQNVSLSATQSVIAKKIL